VESAHARVDTVFAAQADEAPPISQGLNEWAAALRLLLFAFGTTYSRNRRRSGEGHVESISPSIAKALARTWRWAVVLASAIVFIASLTQTACVIDLNFCGDCTGSRSVKPLYFHGRDLLIIGWVGVFWFFNLLVWPLVVAVWVFACMERPLAALIAVSVIAGLVALDLKLDTSRAAAYAAWLANPVIAITWLLYLRLLYLREVRFVALISAVAALGLTLSFLWVKELPGPPPGVNVPDFEMMPIISYGIGYWLWVASAAILAAGVSADRFLLHKEDTR
jgi:hypothetical protein